MEQLEIQVQGMRDPRLSGVRLGRGQHLQPRRDRLLLSRLRSLAEVLVTWFGRKLVVVGMDPSSPKFGREMNAAVVSFHGKTQKVASCSAGGLAGLLGPPPGLCGMGPGGGNAHHVCVVFVARE